MAGSDDAVGRDVDPFSRDRIEAALAAAGFDGRLIEAEPVTHASDTVYILTLDDDGAKRRIVLKHPDLVDDDRFRREARLLSYVGERTSIPVPRVLASVESHDDAPSPFFVAEYVDGTDPETMAADPGPDERVRMAGDCGRNLARLHDLGPLSGYGWVDVDDGALTVLDPTASWGADLRASVEAPLDGLADGRFADLRADLRAHLEREIGRLEDDDPADTEPVPTHNDYRPGNLLVDPETWETLSVLDWAMVGAAPGEYELAKCEQFFSGWAPLGSDVRDRVREALYDGYDDARLPERGPEFERRRNLYLLITRVEAMYWLPYWYEDASEAVRDRVAREHRAFVTELIE